MRTFKYCSVIFSCIAVYASPLPATAQQGAADAMPPRLEKLEEGEVPATPSSDPEENARIIEKRERGQVTSIRVQSGNSTYYVKPNTPVSSAFSSDAQNNATRAAQWQILQFDWNREPEKSMEAAAQAATIAPPPALPAPQKNQ
jgi:hypothetical protein